MESVSKKCSHEVPDRHAERGHRATPLAGHEAQMNDRPGMKLSEA
jgi:hypothetical protein